MLVNYHTHTRRCKHASGEDREYVEKAIESGLQILGFSDHCPWVFTDGFVSGMRLPVEEVDGYFYSLESLKKEYAKDIDFTSPLVQNNNIEVKTNGTNEKSNISRLLSLLERRSSRRRSNSEKQ